MSYDLGVWYADRPLGDAEAGVIYRAFCRDTLRLGGYSPQISAFYLEPVHRSPELHAFPEERVDEGVWNVSPLDRSGMHVLLPMAYSRADEVVPFVRALADKHGLVCFDPQEGRVYLPSSLRP